VAEIAPGPAHERGRTGHQAARGDRFLFHPALSHIQGFVGRCTGSGCRREHRDQHPDDRKALRKIPGTGPPAVPQRSEVGVMP